MGCCASDHTASGPYASMPGHTVGNGSQQPLLSQSSREAKQRRAKKREAAVKELIDTEITYVNSLNRCIVKYYNRLSTETKVINTDDLKILFNDIKTIHQLNSTFLSDLQSQCHPFNNKKTRIGDQFVKFCPYFRMYQNYCNHYDEKMVLLNKYTQKQSFLTLISEIRDGNEGKTLQSLLILPIQRLPRYALCLTEIVKNTEGNHPDLIDLRRALELVQKTTSLINERMKEFESRVQVRAIESRFNTAVSLLKPHRQFKMEGLMTKVHKTGKNREYTFFLFNDLLCYASGSADALKMHTYLPIDEAFYIQDVPHHNKYSDRSFEIHSSVKSFIVHCTVYREKKKWMDLLRATIKERIQLQRGKAQDKGLAAPLMVPDDWSDVCGVKDCDTKFNILNRRHHCRYCGKLICGKCGKYKLASRMDKDRVVKPVCTICFNKYKNIYPAKDDAKEEIGLNDSDDSN